MLTTFEQPHAPGGELVDRHCPPRPDVLLFKKDGVVAAVSMGEPQSGRTRIHLSFEIPGGRTVGLQDSTMGISIARGEQLRSELTGTWYGARNRSAPVDPESLMTGRTDGFRMGTVTGYGVTRHDFYLFSAEFATVLEGTFTLTLPRILVNGSFWDLPPILFTRVRRWLISPLNC